MINAERKRKQRAERKGRQAEIATIWLYRLAGWHLLGTRQKTPFGEIDVIMKKRNRLKFIEVKFRASMSKSAWNQTLETILPSPRQQQRLIKAIHLVSSHWLNRYHKSNFNPDIIIQCDIVLWNGWFNVHIKKDILETL